MDLPLASSSLLILDAASLVAARGQAITASYGLRDTQSCLQLS
jgi:hypothetical protein